MYFDDCVVITSFFLYKKFNRQNEVYYLDLLYVLLDILNSEIRLFCKRIQHGTTNKKPCRNFHTYYKITTHTHTFSVIQVLDSGL